MKKAEITTKQIVSLIILITSFIVILYFLFFMDLGKTSDKELCHNSVVMRAGSVLPSSSTPLDCSTHYFCISQDGSCEKMTNPEIVKVKEEKEVYGVIANEMIDCWWMFGEGNLNYVGDDWKHNNYCSICSQIAFDDSVKKIESFSLGELDKDELYDYLSSEKIEGKDITYAEYLFGFNDLDVLKQEALEQQGVGGTFGKADLDKYHYVVMGIVSDIGWTNWIGSGAAGGAVVGGAIIGAIALSNPVNWVAGALIVGGAIAGGGGVGAGGKILSDAINPEISAITVQGAENKFMAPTFIEVNSDKFKALDCEKIETLS